MPLYEVTFDISRYSDEVDKEAQRLQAGYTGLETYWLFYFRRGMQGVFGRLYGAAVHFNRLHSWFPPRLPMAEADYNLANALFNMDSAMECLVFSMNALGNGKDSAAFHDVTAEAALRRISPANIIGPNPLSGYRSHFPNVQDFWNANVDLIGAVTEYHDVTKHRHAEAGSGQFRLDAPDGFFESLGMDPDELTRARMAPSSVIILGPEAKKPLAARTQNWETSPLSTLDEVMSRFKPFIEGSLQQLVHDAKRL